MTEAVIAVDIGGTKTAAALVGRDQRIVKSLVAQTPVREGPNAIIDLVVSLAIELSGRSGARVRAIGVGTAGVIDVGRGVVISSTDTFTDWTGTSLAARLRLGLEDVIGVDGIVHVQNDVDAHAIGELRHGAAAGASSALVIAVGTGVGASIVLDGGTLRGARYSAGEIAHLPTPGAEHLRCPCGRPGHLEAIGSGTGMYRHFLWLGGDPSLASARAVAIRAQNGDPIALRALRDSAAAVGRGIAAAVTLIDPERVVITGGVAQIGDLWWEPMAGAFHAEVIDALQAITLLPGLLGSEAPLLGAAASVWDLIEGVR